MDPGAFDRLYREHAQRLFAFLTYRTGDRALAEDLLGDVFERALKAHKRFDPARGTEAAWLYAIALNRLRDHLRRAAREDQALSEVREAPLRLASSPLEGVEDRDALVHAMASLTDEERETVALRYGADLSVPQIADVLKTRVTTIEGRAVRALRKLRIALDQEAAPSADSSAPAHR